MILVEVDFLKISELILVIVTNFTKNFVVNLIIKKHPNILVFNKIVFVNLVIITMIYQNKLIEINYFFIYLIIVKVIYLI